MLRPAPTGPTGPSPIAAIVRRYRSTLWVIALTSGVINLLMLTGSLFMMQVYDRVLGSYSVPTLVGLSAIAILAYAFQGWLDIMRQRMLLLIGEKVDAEIGPKVHTASLEMALRSPNGAVDAIKPFRDLEAVRAFMTGQGPVAAFDLPWLPLYVFIAFGMHPWIGYATLIGAVVLLILTWMTERMSRGPGRGALQMLAQRNALAEAGLRGAEVVHAMGMRPFLAARWAETNQGYLLAQRSITFVVSGLASAARSSRMLLQSALLGLGAYLAIKGQISSGAIIAGSILSSRALAPIDQAIAGWRPFIAARDGYHNLNKLLNTAPTTRPFDLALPSNSMVVEELAVGPPGANKVSIAKVDFKLEKGQVLGIIGPSAAGKSSLVRTLIGAWLPLRGKVRLDGAEINQWSPEQLGPAIGYLPQDFQLFDGTIAENIARFDPDATSEEVVAAATAAGFDTLARAFPKGYDTRIGPSGAHLSAGQRQRLGLARALFCDPFLVVLDEPNSNLDPDGEIALAGAIRTVRARGGIVIVVSHRASAIEETDFLLALGNGQQLIFGPRDEVRQKLAPPRRPGAQGPGGPRGGQQQPFTVIPRPAIGSSGGDAGGGA